MISKCKKKIAGLTHFLLSKLFYECLDVLLLYITKIYNYSLASDTFPSLFKDSLVKPLLKKPSLEAPHAEVLQYINIILVYVSIWWHISWPDCCFFVLLLLFGTVLVHMFPILLRLQRIHVQLPLMLRGPSPSIVLYFQTEEGGATTLVFLYYSSFIFFMNILCN